jgi:GNAT superfamily N-acetyltransferase
MPVAMVRLRAGTASREDVDEIVALSEAVFAEASMTAWRPHHIHAHLDRFPAGQTVVRVDGGVVGSSTTMLAREDVAMGPHTWTSITGGSTLRRHDPEGQVLYGLEIVVHPDERGQGLGRLLYDMRKVLVRRLDLEALVVVGRIPGFAEVHEEDGIPAETYVEEVVSDKRRDPVLSRQLAVGLEPAGIVPNYVLDPASHHNGVRLRWEP